MPIEIKVVGGEFWDETHEEFIQVPPSVFHLEHCLKAVAKWEALTKKPFLSQEGLSGDDLLTYIRCMTIEEGIPNEVYQGIRPADAIRIREYLEDPMTATWFKKDPAKAKKAANKVITAEIIYYYMVELGIPFECENWHLNRLMTLINVCAEKQTPPKKMAKKDVLSQYASLNAARKAKLGTKG